MAIADASSTRLAYLAETAPGVIPATPTWKQLRYTSEGIKVTKQTDTSDEVRADGNVATIMDVGRSVEGPIAFELSYATFDDSLEGLFRSTWASDVLKNGVQHKTFALEKTFEQGATDSFLRYRGCRVNTMDLTMNAKQKVTGSFGMLGLGSPAPATAIIAGATYTAPNSNPVINASANVAALGVTGPASSPKVKSLSLSIKSNLYANDVVAQAEADSHGLGRFEVTGSMQTYFENLDTYNAIMNHSDVALSVTLGAETLKKYTLLIPKLKLMDGSPAVGGNSQSVMIEVPFSAYFDPTIAAAMQITRAVA